MKKYLSIGEAAKAVHTTSETLRHYDRIGLVKPSQKDECTNYRYYTEHDIVWLNTGFAAYGFTITRNKKGFGL